MKVLVVGCDLGKAGALTRTLLPKAVVRMRILATTNKAYKAHLRNVLESIWVSSFKITTEEGAICVPQVCDKKAEAISLCA